MNLSPVSTLWLLVCTCLVALMQAGFLCLEAGLTRSKNSINVAVKNVAGLGVSSFFFWLIGYTIMFGRGVGTFTLGDHSEEPLFFLFQLMFCATAVTIISGGAAERLSFSGYMAVVSVVAIFIYPILGRLIWFGLAEGVLTGWLAQIGFVDFAGVSMVHSIGGWCCLALLLIVGPRTGRFDANGEPQKITGSNLPFAALGVMILWVGWFGFNGGSVLALNDQVIIVFLNTLLTSIAGLIATIVVSLMHHGKVTAEAFLNGPLAGLVALTGVIHAVNEVESVIIGFIGGLVTYGVDYLLLKWRIDDAVGAVPVHLGAGLWGTIAVALFGHADLLGTGLSFGQQMMAQMIGLALVAVWSFGVAYLVFWLINIWMPLRVPLYAEKIGLNVYEHEASTDILDMFLVMDEQARSGDLSLRVPEEPFTEVGQIAQKYNHVMSRLEQSVARVEAILENAQEGIMTFAPQTWHILSANGMAEYILQAPAAELTRSRLTDFLAQTFVNPRDLMVTRVDQFVEVAGRRLDGTSFPMEIAIGEVRTDEIWFFTILFRDITQRKKIITDLSVARDEALQASRFKDQLLAMVGHELRTPIAAISGSAELIDEAILGPVNAEQKKFLAQIIDNSIHLHALVNDLIEQSHLQSGRVRLNMYDFKVADLIEQVSYPLQRLARDKGLAFEINVADEMPPEICSDATRLNQIMTNLVSNSIKYTDQGSVSLEIRPESNTHWEIMVQDTGIGIPLAKQKAIFEPFEQVESVVVRKQGGVGLGLAIVQQLVALMQGEIELQSTPSVGTVVKVILPYYQPFAE